MSAVLVIEILKGEAEHVAGQNRERGTSWDFYSQQAFASTGEVYPTPITVVLPEGDPKPYAPGFYVLPAGAIRKGKVALEVTWRTGRLVPVADAIRELSDLQKRAPGAGSAVRAVAAG